MLDNLFRPAIDNKTLNDLLIELDWKKVTICYNYSYFSTPHADDSIFEVLKKNFESEFRTNKDQKYWVLCKEIVNVDGVPRLFVRKPELTKSEEADRADMITVEMKPIETRENLDFLNAIAKEGFGIAISVDPANLISGRVRYDELNIFGSDPDKIKSTKCKVVQNPYPPKED